MTPQSMHGAATGPVRFSVLVANHNHGLLVGRAVDSVLTQDYPAERCEVIVVDDGSTDDSRAVLARYAGSPQVRLVFQDNRGQTGAFAAALAHAQGDVVCLLDADDRFLPGKLRRLADVVQRLSLAPQSLFLCHDVDIRDGADGAAIATTWFDVAGLRRFGTSLHVAVAQHFFPFSVTSGQVYGRALLARIMDEVPVWDWPMGSDAILGHAAMVMAGEVQYLPEVLGSYVVHGGNNFAAVEGGVFRQQPVWHGRWPKKLRFLEALVDSIDFSDRDRADRMGYLGRVEHAVRAVPSGRPMASPLLSFVLDVGTDATLAAATVQAIQQQTHRRCEIVWVAADGVGQPLPGMRVACVAPDATGFDRLRAGLQAATGSYLCFLEAGDVPDRRFAERHLHAHRYGNMPMLTACDLRLVDAQGALLHTGVLGTAAGWNAGPPNIAPFAAGVRDWHLAPLPAVVFRRSVYLDAFFATRAIGGPPRCLGWLLCQWLLQVGGGTRIVENLLDYRLPAAAAPNPFWWAMPADRRGPLPAPDLGWAAEALFAAHARARAAQASWLPESWEARFLRWLLQAAGPAVPQVAASIGRLARDSGDAVWASRIAAMLQAAAARP